MEFYEARNILRTMRKAYLLELASKQEIRRCVVGGKECSLHLTYEGFGFCVSEILGQGCQVQRAKDEFSRDLNGDSPPPLTDNPNCNGNQSTS
jgi:hypothetical protein